MSEYVARIRPESGREIHIVEGFVFNVARGWYEIPESMVEKLQSTTVHELRSVSPPVFEVKLKEEARAQEELLKKRADAHGTLERPVVLTQNAMLVPGAPKPKEPSVAIDAPSVDSEKRRVRRAAK